jgi:hypothetical protein
MFNLIMQLIVAFMEIPIPECEPGQDGGCIP